MIRIRHIALTLALLIGISGITGCGDSSTSIAPTASTPAATSPAGIVVANAADPATNPIAAAAHDFLDAVLKGDTQRASARLTPAAMQRIIAGREQFAPQGLDNATFRIGEVRTPSETQAIVQCVLTGPDKEGKPKDEEMCCLMKRVENEWRVSGIAYSTGPNRPPMILDFESPPQQKQQQQVPMAAAPAPGESAPPATGRPSPPRTAQEPTPPAFR